jgi:threonine dehydrogenase-like Zn-dependent dehydrogenase
MRAAVLRHGAIVVDDVPEPPAPGPGEILVETVAAGICGSDLHVRRHVHEFVDVNRSIGNDGQLFDPGRDVVLGHELSFRVLRTGPGVDRFAVGDYGAGYPTVVDPTGLRRTVGYANDYPGGFGERMLLDAGAALPLPPGLDPAVAALTEPLTVGEVSARRSRIEPEQPAVVLGSGPVGLGTVAALARRGVKHIVVAEPSPLRREAAARLGAHVPIDPAERSWVTELPLGAPPPVVFNTTGRPGMLDRLFHEAPWSSHIVEVSGLMTLDTYRPIAAVIKNLTVSFSSEGGPEQFGVVLRSLADGSVDGDSLITGRVGLDGVAAAFDELEVSPNHIKILVEPGLD